MISAFVAREVPMQFIRKLARGLLWCSTLLIAIAVLAYGALLLINWRDDPASAAAKQLAAVYAGRPAVADQDNAYLYLLGFGAVDGQSPIELGRKRIEWMTWASKQPWSEELVEPQYPHWKDRSNEHPLFVDPLLEACDANSGQCAQRLISHEQRLDEWLKQEHFLLQRYQELIGLSSMHEPLPFNMRSVLPEYQHVRTAQRLLLVRAWQLTRQGEHQQATALLQADLQFWRMALAQSDVMISRMLACAAIRHHFLWAIQMFQREPAKHVAQPTPASWHQALTAEELAWERTHGGELAFLQNYLQQMQDGELNWLGHSDESDLLQRAAKVLGPPLLLKQVTQNQYAEFLLRRQELFSAPYPSLIAAKAESLALSNAYTPKRIGLIHLHNLGGNLLHMQNDTDTTDYYLRVFDLESLRRASLVLAEMRNQQVPPSEVPAYLRRSALQDPYMEKPFAWNEAAGSLQLEGLEEGSSYQLIY